MQSIISRLIYRPQISKTAILHGWHIFSRNVKIGDYTSIAQNNFLANIEIGKFCSIAMGLSAGLGEHPMESFSNYCMVNEPTSPFVSADFSTPLKNSERVIKDSKKITVGNDVWIGANVTIKSGVTIGNGAVIGSSAVVTKDVPSYAVVAGVPAKIIRYRFEQEKIDYLQEKRWWDLPLNELKRQIPELDRFGKVDYE